MISITNYHTCNYLEATRSMFVCGWQVASCFSHDTTFRVICAIKMIVNIHSQAVHVCVRLRRLVSHDLTLMINLL